MKIFEQCIVCLNVEEMQFGPLLNFVNKYTLFTALCHMYTCIFKYHEPILEMINYFSFTQTNSRKKKRKSDFFYLWAPC